MHRRRARKQTCHKEINKAWGTRSPLATEQLIQPRKGVQQKRITRNPIESSGFLSSFHRNYSYSFWSQLTTYFPLFYLYAPRNLLIMVLAYLYPTHPDAHEKIFDAQEDL